ncbi:hypothetical protein L7F22_015083 [Adiantum nelumboides]|nr:hypothetical protein [Adiantum nelumboides]
MEDDDEEEDVSDDEEEPTEGILGCGYLIHVSPSIGVFRSPKECEKLQDGSSLVLDGRMVDNTGLYVSLHRLRQIESQAVSESAHLHDQFATLPPIIPEGPIAILGLGGGTTARLMLDLWSSCKLLGWELMKFPNRARWNAQGIIVDLFANGEVLPQLQESKVWLELKKRLKEGGRIMINCGGICVEKSDSMLELDDGTWTWEDGGYAKEATLRAMVKVSPQTLFRKMGGESDYYMALTGSLPDLAFWAAALPSKLQADWVEWSAIAHSKFCITRARVVKGRPLEATRSSLMRERYRDEGPIIGHYPVVGDESSSALVPTSAPVACSSPGQQPADHSTSRYPDEGPLSPPPPPPHHSPYPHEHPAPPRPLVYPIIPIPVQSKYPHSSPSTQSFDHDVLFHPDQEILDSDYSVQGYPNYRPSSAPAF